MRLKKPWLSHKLVVYWLPKDEKIKDGSIYLVTGIKMSLLV